MIISLCVYVLHHYATIETNYTLLLTVAVNKLAKLLNSQTESCELGTN